MPTIEQLNFDLIIDDKKFNAQVQKALKDARDLNTQLSTLLNLRKQFAGAAAGAAADERDLAKAIEEQTRKVKENSKAIRAGTSAAKAYNAARRTMKNFNMNGEIFSGSKGSLSELTSLAAQYVSILGGAQLVKAITQVTAEFELQRTTLRAILQDIEGADAIFSQIKSLAVMSPFSFKELVTYAKQLSAYSIPMGELYETTKMLADVSAGLGVGMDRLVLAYGQIRSASFLRGQEVRQLTEAGIPILEDLRKQFVELGEEGITVGDVFDKISNRMVPFEMVSKVFQNMTSEGGKFYQMQEVQAETLRGKISNLKDAYGIMFDKIGNKNMGALKGAVDMVRSLAENYQRTGRWLAELIALYGTYKVALALAAVGEKTVAAVGTITRISQMARMMKVMTGQTHLFAVALRTLGASGMKTALAGIAGIFALIATGIVKAIKNAGEFQRELNKLVNEKYSGSEKLANDFQKLVQRLREATVGSGDYRRAISELNNKYGEYLPNLLNEKNALSEIAKVEQSVTNAIYARAKAYTETEGMQRIEEKYGKQLDALYSGIVGFISPSLGKEQAERFAESFKNHIMHTDDPLSIGAYFEQFFGKDIYSVLKENTQYLTDIGGRYIKQVQRIGKEYDKLTKKIDNRWGDKTVYSSEAQYQAIYKIEEDFAKKEAEIKNKSLTVEEEKQALLDNEIAKLEAIKKAYEDLNKEAAELGNPGSWNNLIGEVQKKLDALRPKDSTWLQRIVNAYVTGNGVNDLKVKQEDKYSEYLDNLRKEYKSVVAEVADAEGTYNKLVSDKRRMAVVDEDALKKAKQQLDNLTNRKKVIEDIGKALGVSVNDKVKTTSSSGKSEEQTELETRINTMKELLTWYEKLKDAGMGEDQIKSVLSAFFPDKTDIINAGSYKQVLLEMADALEKYGDSAKKTAQGLREDVLGVGLGDILDKFKDRERFTKELGEWLGQPFGKSGSGSLFDINSIALKYKRALEKIADERDKLIADANRNAESAEELVMFPASITAKSFQAEEDALAEANESLRKEAEDWVKSWDKIASFDIERFGDLSARELRKLKQTLETFASSDIPENIKNALGEVNGGLDSFLSGVDAFIRKLQRKTDEKLADKLFQDLKGMVGDLQTMLSSAQNLAETAGDKSLASTISGISSAISGTFEILEKIKDKDYAGAAVSGITQIAAAIMDTQTRALNASNAFAELKRDIAAYLAELELTKNSNEIFGENTVESIRNALKVAEESRVKLSGYDGLTLKLGVTFAGIGGHNTSLEDAIRGLGLDYDDEKQRLEGIKSILEMSDVDLSGYASLTRKQKEALAEYEAALEAYIAANEQVTEIITDTWSSVAGTIAQSMIDAYVEMGDAGYGLAEDMEDVFSDLGQSIAKQLISSFIIDTVLAKYKDDLQTLYEEMGGDSDRSRIAQVIGQIASGVSKDITGVAEVTNQLMSALEQYGITFSESTDNLASGISSITEDTANLLASYINAMRSDLAGHRVDVQGIGADVKALLGLMPSAPTLAEYLTQIQANTCNTAANTAAILARIDSVVGDGASSYIRIQ